MHYISFSTTLWNIQGIIKKDFSTSAHFWRLNHENWLHCNESFVAIVRHQVHNFENTKYNIFPIRCNCSRHFLFRIIKEIEDRKAVGPLPGGVVLVCVGLGPLYVVLGQSTERSMFITMYWDKEKRKTDRDRWYLCRWWRKRNDELRHRDVCWLAWVREKTLSVEMVSLGFFFFFLMDLFVCCVILTFPSFACFRGFPEVKGQSTGYFGLSFQLLRAKGPRGAGQHHCPALHSLPRFRLQLCYQAPGCRKCFPNQQELLLCPQGANKTKEILRQSSPQILSWISSKLSGISVSKFELKSGQEWLSNGDV